jgi:hypothetical protein
VAEELPEEIRDYLTDSLALPVWADMGKIKRAQQLYETWGVLITLCPFCASLPASYAAAKGVKVQGLSPELRWVRVLVPEEISYHQKALKKMREGAWLFAVFMAMNPGNAGQKTAHQEAWTVWLSSWYLQPSGRFSPLPTLVHAVAKHEKHNVSSQP